jgi:hypothetical protein
VVTVSTARFLALKGLGHSVKHPHALSATGKAKAVSLLYLFAFIAGYRVNFAL